MSAHAASGREHLSAGIAERERALAAFFEHEQTRLAHACHELARAFARGGTLVAFGTGAAATDAAHVAVEFMHPVIVGKRALPALALTNDATGAARGSRLAGAGDVALAIAHGPPDPAVERFLDGARERGALTLVFGAAGSLPTADYAFPADSEDPQVVQEVHETAYHVLWELVHVFFEQPGLLDEACITCGDVAVEATVVAVRGATAMVESDGAREEVAVELVEDVREGDVLLCHAGVALERLAAGEGEAGTDDPSGFLYPFMSSSAPADLDTVIADVRASSVHKAREAIALRRDVDLDAVRACAKTVRERLERGGRLIAFGNGGSSTDAQDLAADALARGWPALALNDDVATVTAVGNDVGFENVFARQLISLARPADVAIAITTSGSSANALAGLEEAHRRTLLTIGIAGYDGGRLAQLDWLDHLFVVGSDYVPRLQEAHATIYHLILDAIGEAP
ncbi:MAG TPA: SIS domain-containing protein [Solirubrobacteraceae bacterium]|nr:SIS domain-containing protein [Solirubrobacteraceae bacterium]